MCLCMNRPPEKDFRGEEEEKCIGGGDAHRKRNMRKQWC